MAVSEVMDATNVVKAQPYTFDLGHLLCNDTNPLPALPPADIEKETILRSVARDCAQGLINQLLSTCQITPSTDGENLLVHLPAPETPLPREKPVPKEKEKTKWERFAEKKGIKAKRKDGKLVYDEAKGAWAPKYGYKGKSSGGVSDDWLEEVDEKQERRDAKAASTAANGADQRRQKKTKLRNGK